MFGILILCVCLLVGLWSCFGFPIWPVQLRCPTNQQVTPNDDQQAAEETAQPSEDEPEASASEYDVFLSFRGQDSRQGLADVLYEYLTTAGVRVFRDNDELEAGDQISKILPAIENSKICVPIFSKTFASSFWCLREVETMVVLKKTIMPIFYTATPDDLKLTTELFKTDLRNHEKKHGREKVKKWEDALKVIAKIKGREVNTTGFAKFSTSFMKAVLIKLKVKQKHLIDYLVKRDDDEKAVIELLDTSCEDLRLIGIYGMGGIGKTTLAKVVFNQLSDQFDCCSFLENIQESLRQHDGLEYLQKQLLGDLNPKLKHFVEKIHTNRILRETFQHSKVLIVLDDVNERKQINMITGMLGWFGYGSRIIVTTKDKRVLTREDRAFEVKAMDYDQALQLLSKHAFGEDAPPVDYHFLANKVLSLTGRNPLAIEVIGSSLYQREKKIWRAMIKKLEKIPSNDIKEMLKAGPDALEYEDRQIFLDIACFFINKEMSTPIYLWEACDYFPDVGIDVLISSSLVKISDNNGFWMHDLIRDLGRELVREECFGNPARRSRIWKQKEASEVLKIKQEKEKVEGLFLQEGLGDSNLTHEHFSSLRNLRLLKLVDVKLAGGHFEDLLSKLKWFSWHRCPSNFATTINLSLPGLVVLDLSHSFISERWTGWNIIKMARNLKALDLTWCSQLKSTPDLSGNTSLERLSLRNCRRLLELHGSISNLKRLKHLDLKGCYSLKGLPEDIGSLEDLEEILVDGNNRSFNLPDSIGKLQSLSAFELCGVEITRIPDAIGGLVNLTRLSLYSCSSMERLPNAIGDLISLGELDLAYTEINMLPESIGQLVKLSKLDLSYTRVNKLPKSIGQLVQLVDLDLSATEITVLPDSVEQLVRLESLLLEFTELQSLPDWVGNFHELDWLSLEGSNIRSLPSTIWSLPMLSYLSAFRCKYLTEVTIPAGTRDTSQLNGLDLTVSCPAQLSSIIDQLPGLRELSIEFRNNSLVENQAVDHPDESSSGPSSLATSPLDLSALTSLKWLKLNCSGLKVIVRPFPSTLSNLELSHVKPDTELPYLSNLANLRNIQFRQCYPRDTLVLVEGLRVLKRLASMEITDCSDELIDFITRQLESLRQLLISSRPESSTTCLDLSHLKRLEALTLKGFRELAEVRGLGVLNNLLIEECPSLRNIDELKRRCRLGRINGLDVTNDID